MMSKMFFYFLLVGLLFSACYNDNHYIINRGVEIHKNYSSELEDLLPLFDSTFLDSCNVFHINMSPRTKLFVQEGSIDHLYDSSLVRIISKSQEEEIRKKKPRKELVGIWYLKNVFLAFVIDDANHYSLDLSYLVRIIDSTKFNSVYNNFKCYSELSAIDKKSSNWIYPVDEQWSICTGDLVHNGSDSICFYLKSR